MIKRIRKIKKVTKKERSLKLKIIFNIMILMFHQKKDIKKNRKQILLKIMLRV